jgi:hypothetical protein
MLPQEARLDQAAIGNNRDGFQTELFLAEVDHLTEELGGQERLSPSEIDLVYACFGEEAEAFFGSYGALHMRGGGGMEAEATRLVAKAGEVVVEGNRDSTASPASASHEQGRGKKDQDG